MHWVGSGIVCSRNSSDHFPASFHFDFAAVATAVAAIGDEELASTMLTGSETDCSSG